MKYKTAARCAEEQLADLLGKENRVYHDWQLENHLLTPIRIEGTVDDVLLLAKSKTYTRPQFSVTERAVTVPNLFVKLNGDIKGFYLDMKQLSAGHGDIVALYSSFKKMARPPRKKPLISKPSWFDDQAGIDIEATLALGIANLRLLRPVYQRNYLMAINRVLKRLKSVDYLAEKPTNRAVLETLLFNSNKIIRMFHQFDYQYLNPKFIVKEESSNSINQFAVLRLMMMDALGFDVFILSEKGYASVENYLSEGLCRRYFLTAKERQYSAVLRRRRRFGRYLLAALLAGGTIVALIMLLKHFIN